MFLLCFVMLQDVSEFIKDVITLAHKHCPPWQLCSDCRNSTFQWVAEVVVVVVVCCCRRCINQILKAKTSVNSILYIPLRFEYRCKRWAVSWLFAVCFPLPLYQALGSLPWHFHYQYLGHLTKRGSGVPKDVLTR